jgi:hypothetical protein
MGVFQPGRRWAVLVGVAAAALTLVLAPASAGAVVAREALPPPDTCIAPLLPCYIVLSIDSGSRGNLETVTGVQFWPGEPFTVYYWDGIDGAPAAIVASGTTGTGSFSASFGIPKDPVGNYTVFVTDLAGDNQSAPFHETWLHAAPNAGVPGNTTSLSGQGFLPDHVVTFTLHGARVPTRGACTTDRDGVFSGCIATVPDVPTGTTRLAATDGTYLARLAFDVS